MNGVGGPGSVDPDGDCSYYVPWLAAGMPAIDRYLEAPSQSGFPMIAHARST